MDKHNNTTINFEENVILYEIEENDDFDYDSLPEEEQRKLDQYNETFDKDLEDTLLDTIFPDNSCSCQYTGQEITQEDVDQFKFMVTIITKNGEHDTVGIIVRECKKCHKIEYYGSGEIFFQLLNEATVNFINNHKNNEDEIETIDIDEVITDENMVLNSLDEDDIIDVDSVKVDE